jgi:hypothetical protein
MVFAMSELPMCSCGREPVERGNDLCGYCRQEEEQRQQEREADEEERQARLARWQKVTIR